MNVAVIGGGYWGVNLIRIFHRLGVLGCICDFKPERIVVDPDVRVLQLRRKLAVATL